jgi:hypothetical protein
MRKVTDEQWAGLKRHLAEGGCPVLPEERFGISPVGLKIEQVPNLGSNILFDLESHQTGCVLDAMIANETERIVKINGFRIKTPWDGSGVSLLGGPEKSGARQGNYCFPGPAPLMFEGEIVLNGFFARRGLLHPGEERRGLLLGVEESSIPSHYPEHGRTVVELIVIDAKGNRYSSEFRVCIDRSVSCAREQKEKITARISKDNVA